MNDGGPAYPTFKKALDNEGTVVFLPDQPGMSLRDWFAGLAISLGEGVWDSNWPGVAAKCYKLADAMLAEREKGRTDG